MHELTIAPYQRKHRTAAQDLLVHNYHVHTHLDWYDVDEWLGSTGSPVRVALQGSRLVGLLGASAPLNGAVWVRLAAVRDHHLTQEILRALWNDLTPELRALGAAQAAMLLLRDWPEAYLPALGFEYLEHIVTLRRSDAREPAEEAAPGCIVRHAREEDIAAITAVDHAAFAPPWQMTAGELARAERSSAYSTVALDPQGALLGYQMSTLYFDGAHLARLAVHPQTQDHGVGRFLVSNMLRQFWRRGVFGVTVNTQDSNAASQRLYTRLGFARTGYDLPVWLADLTDA